MLRLSHRHVLAGTALAAVPFSLWRAGAIASAYSGYAASRIRHEASTPEGEAMLQKLARAVSILRARGNGDPTGWNFQWYIHWVPDNTNKQAELDKIPEDQRPLASELWNTCRAHDEHMDESLFLPWHRAYVFFFERIVREALDDDAFTMPYWDITDPAERALPKLFLEPTDSSNGLYYADRKAEVNAGQPVDFQYNGHSPLNADALDQEDYGASDVTQGMCMALDKGVHASVHVLIGNMHGMGAVQWAANDPIFWLVHADMDRLWVSRLKSGRTNPTTEAWLDTEFVFADENGQRVAMKVRDFLDAETLGYGYDRLAPVAFAAGVALVEGGGGGPPAEAAPEGNVAAAPPSDTETATAQPQAPPPPPPPPTRAAPPPLQARAPSAPGSSVLSHGPVRVGSAPTQVTLGQPPPRIGAAPPATTAAPSGGGAPTEGARPGNAAPPPRPALRAAVPSRLFLVIRNLQAKAQPGVLYDVFATVTVPNGQGATARLGSINFFDAVQHAAMPGMTMQQSFVSFEVTNTLALARAPGAKLEVTIAAVGQPASNAAPVIGNISLVEKPA